jgi:pilus assembly protein Flp/PilA
MCGWTRAREVSSSEAEHESGGRPIATGDKAMKQMLMKLWKDEEAPTAVEYGIMVALIAVVIITAVSLVGTNLDTLFTSVAGELEVAE